MSIPETSPTSELSEREREILRLVATGASNKLIAQRLYISPNTVKVHLRNIFAKIGVASRTEATLYAIRSGIVGVPGTITTEASAPDGAMTSVSAPHSSELLPVSSIQKRSAWQIRLTLIALVAFSILIGLSLRGSSQFGTRSPFPSTPIVSQWEDKAPMPTARSGLGTVVYENQIYAIGGESPSGVTGAVERYDPTTNQWAILTPKPIAVADVGAVVIGGRIYVPGGRLTSGQPTDLLEVYDPRLDRWEKRAPLPILLSAYALAAFEGKLYLFGGWDGQHFVASVYEYDPDANTWRELTPMPTARGFTGAAVAGGRIYVIGGTGGTLALAVNEEYSPEADTQTQEDAPWRQRAALPEGRYRLGVTSLADIVYAIGGEGTRQPPLPFAYLPQNDRWQLLEVPGEQPTWSKISLVGLESSLHALGGVRDTTPLSQHMTYQAVYTLSLPVITR